MSLADEFLADFENEIENESEIEIENENESEIQNNKVEFTKELPNNPELLHNKLLNNDIILYNQESTNNKINNSLEEINNIKKITKLSEKLEEILGKIESIGDDLDVNTNVENETDNEEFKLIVEANTFIVETNNEIIILYKIIKDYYKKRFPELDLLIKNPIEYAKTILLIKNDIQNIPNIEQELKNFLPSATCMVLNMSSIEKIGENLLEDEINFILKLCNLTISLDNGKSKLISFVSKKIFLFAPNTCNLIGSQITTQLISFVGDLLALSKVPSCNLPSLGSNMNINNSNASNNSNITIINSNSNNIKNNNKGFIYNSNILQSVPNELHKKAIKIISSKITLAVRMDLCRSFTDGSFGTKLYNEFLNKIEKLLQPPENKGPKALPIPFEKLSKKRGGKRFRKYKEQFIMSDLKKAQNRIAFGKEELEFTNYDESDGLGLLGTNNSGTSDIMSTTSIRALVNDSKNKPKLSKTMQARLSNLNSSLLNRQNNGLSSTIAFTPVQGIELINPKLLDNKINKDNDKWFKSGTFTQINTKKNHSNSNEIVLAPQQNTTNDKNQTSTSFSTFSNIPAKRSAEDKLPEPSTKR